MVRGARFELAILSEPAPQAGAYASSATRAKILGPVPLLTIAGGTSSKVPKLLCSFGIKL